MRQHFQKSVFAQKERMQIVIVFSTMLTNRMWDRSKQTFRFAIKIKIDELV